jgi:hypothetical protein
MQIRHRAGCLAIVGLAKLFLAAASGAAGCFATTGGCAAPGMGATLAQPAVCSTAERPCI